MAERDQLDRVIADGVTLCLSGMGVLAERFGQLLGPQRWTSFLMAGGRLVGIHVENADETTLTRYFHTDHLGSIAVITTAELTARRSWTRRERAASVCGV